MKTKKERKQAISLIVLIITIIVMIILAGAIVLTLNNSGIINKASEAVEKSDEATIKQLAALGWAEAYAEYGADQEKLEQGVKATLTKNNLDLEDYGMIVTTNGVEITTGWLQSGLTVVKGTQKLEIGDVINYDETKGGTVTVETDVTWKVLGAENGELLIVSADEVETDYPLGDVNGNAEKGGNLDIAKDGYINGVSYLNDICAAYGKGEGATRARSIRVEDIDKITGYNPETTELKKGEIGEYGNEITFSWTGNDDPYYTTTNNLKGDMLPDYHNGSFIYFNGEEFVTSTNEGATAANPIEITTLKKDFYWYYPTTLTTSSSGDVKGLTTTSKQYKMLFRNSENTSYASYWLASPYVEVGYSRAFFGIRTIANGRMGHRYFVYSDGRTWGVSRGVRAVVSLSSDITFTGSSESGWRF